MKIITYNVNGIRAAQKKGFNTWLADENADVVCLQEVKANEDQVNLASFEKLGYNHIIWHSAEKKGYSGVAVLSKIQPLSNRVGVGNTTYDVEGRLVTIEYEDFNLINTYFPSGTSGEERQNFKYRWLNFFSEYIKEVSETKPFIIVGDLNIAHTAMDIHNPTRNKNTSGFQPEERAWLSKFLESGFVDSFRELHQEVQKFSWWSYRANARKKNLGWRIDYILVSELLKNNIKHCDMLNEVYHSDHCPVVLQLK